MKVPEKAPLISELLPRLPPQRLVAVLEGSVGSATGERYLHWDDLRWRKTPRKLSREEWWVSLKLSRAPLFKTIPLLDKNGTAFRFCVPDMAQRRLHMVDQNLSGAIALSELVVSPSTRDRYVVSSLMEEAITSSQLEGASTTRQVAKDMIRSGRAPRDRSERMIMNNYLAMERVGELRDEPFTADLVLELHRSLARDTLSSRDAEGRLQLPGEVRVQVWSAGPDSRILHSPPNADELPERLMRMCGFANGEFDDGFIHPVIRAIILHFWLAYDHPFEDGNGRTARALFYWSMLAQKYWLAEFLTISKILRRAPAQYARSFLLTETDENDLTYFILYHLAVIEKAIAELHSYLRHKMEEIREAEISIRESAHLNHRQLALISHAMRHPDHTYTVASHQRSHRVVYQTARTDLLALVEAGYLTKIRLGKAFGFMPDPSLAQRLLGSQQELS